jgi:2-polyprenyl-6-methoxyphenol hydroxylase-like FAD-dependent oxidoreductase
MKEAALTTRCCIVGGGPAGVMAGFLLARAGIDVQVLEKWPDFFRDFRGDTIHPATMELLHELGLLEKFLKLPHQEARELQGQIGPHHVTLVDFSHLKVRSPFIAFIPQWDFLNFIVGEAKRYPTFHLQMGTEAVDLVEEHGEVVGVRAQSGQGALEVRAELVIGADGRHSTVREKAGLEVRDIGAPMDVLWFRLPRRDSDPKQVLGRVDYGMFMIMIDRADYWQCGFIIRKSGFDGIKREGLEAFRRNIVRLAPFMSDRAMDIVDWSAVKLLTVAVDCLRTWHKPGLLCIGDSAHAMSPIGGVGINLAIQDAVAAANILAPRLQRGRVTARDLALVQKRREFPSRMIQRIQVFIQNRVISRVLSGGETRPGLPWPLRLLQRYPLLRRVPGRAVGIGFRSEHISSAISPPEGREGRAGG